MIQKWPEKSENELKFPLLCISFTAPGSSQWFPGFFHLQLNSLLQYRTSWSLRNLQNPIRSRNPIIMIDYKNISVIIMKGMLNFSVFVGSSFSSNLKLMFYSIFSLWFLFYFDYIYVLHCYFYDFSLGKVSFVREILTSTRLKKSQ